MIAATLPRFTKVSAEGVLLPFNTTEQHVGVYDSLQLLTWTRRTVPGGARNWKKSMAACTALDLCGWTGRWRAGSRLEWAHLIDDARIGPCLDTDFFTVASDEYWSWTGTECAPAGDAWFVTLGYGSSSRFHQAYHGHVFAVCPGQLYWPSDLGAAA